MSRREHDAAHEDAADGKAVNIGSTDNIEIKTLATEIRDQIDPDLDLVYEERHDADAEHTHAATDRAEELLGYDPDHTIREGVAKFIDWYRDNRDWYEPLVRQSETSKRSDTVRTIGRRY